MKPFEVIEHTADIGIKAQGRTPEELFAHMAQGMFGLIVSPEEVRALQRIPVAAQAQDWDHLLVAWLRELLFLFDTQHFLAASFEIHRLEPTRIEATAIGEKLDPARHHVDKEVKAATYCDLTLKQQPDGSWVAQVIFDI